jgi:hypothetical protein
MNWNGIAGGLMAVLGLATSAPLIAEKPAGPDTVRSSAGQAERKANSQSLTQSDKPRRRERVRHTFPPSKR